MPKARVSGSLEPVVSTEVIDPSGVLPVVIRISDDVKRRQEDSTAKGMIMLNAISEKKKKKQTDIIESDNLNELDLESILTKDDHLFYQEKKSLYIEYYPDLGNDPFDLDDLHLMIMEQVFQRNLLKRKKKHPTIDIAKDYESSVKRQDSLKKSLSMRRTDRVKAKATGGPKINIAKISLIFADPEKMLEMHRRLEANREEEQRLLQGKNDE